MPDDRDNPIIIENEEDFQKWVIKTLQEVKTTLNNITYVINEIVAQANNNLDKINNLVTKAKEIK